jgi:hypothetical protein
VAEGVMEETEEGWKLRNRYRKLKMILERKWEAIHAEMSSRAENEQIR